jgi:hypothetical protein
MYNGFDGRIINLPFVQAAHQAGQALPQLQQLMYVVNFNTMTRRHRVRCHPGGVKTRVPLDPPRPREPAGKHEPTGGCRHAMVGSAIASTMPEGGYR